MAVSVMAETVYKNTNPDGSVTFTDKNSADSEEVKIRKPTTYKPIGLPSLNLPGKKSRPSFDYTLTIIQPANNLTIRNQSNVPVSVSVQPALKTGLGHQIRYQVSGQSIVSQNTSEIFNNVSRGAHNISVSIVDQDGIVVSPVASSAFHIKRESGFFQETLKNDDDSDNDSNDGLIKRAPRAKMAPKAPMAPKFRAKPKKAK